MPWVLAKDESKQDRLATVLYNLLESIRISAVLLHSFLPETAEKMFDDLAKEAKVDIEANRKTVAAYNDCLLQAQKQNGVVSRFKVLRGFLIFLIIVLFGTAIVGVILCTNQNFNLVIGLSMAIGGVVLGVLFLVLILKVVNKKIKNNKEILEAIQEEANKYLDEASSQMGNLNALFDWSVPSKICEKATPLIKLDPIFDNEKYGYLYEKYGFAHSEENNKSIVGVQSEIHFCYIERIIKK